MKKVIIRRDLVTKAIIADVEGVRIDIDCEINTNSVRVLVEGDIGDRVIEACYAYAKKKNVPARVRYWGDGTREFRFHESPPTEAFEFCDKANPCHY